MKQKKTGSKGIRELLLPFLLLLFIAITASCGGGGGGGVPSGGSGGATLSSIAVTPANPSIAVGATQQFTATGTYSDSSTQNVTSSATWSSSDTTRATINASGLATAVAAGPTTITATSGNILGNTLLTVNIVVGSSVNLPETGQTTCYDTAGTAIACAGTGQDGELLKGVAWPSPRFMDNGNGTVTDNLTGLIWLKDANCFISRTWADALLDANSLANGSCGLTDGSSAGNWRLPNVNELESLLNAEQADMIIWLETQGFSNVDAFYWSASTTANAVNRAWEVTMEDNGSVSRSGKNNTSFVWPVRAGQ